MDKIPTYLGFRIRNLLILIGLHFFSIWLIALFILLSLARDMGDIYCAGFVFTTFISALFKIFLLGSFWSSIYFLQISKKRLAELLDEGRLTWVGNAEDTARFCHQLREFDPHFI
ncbi:hypothetical protein P171DRAFT_492015 [Karstenula rhodostoma CBS 690.94]|uniref:Uncharacterized protein n=1 Tax=Karstenula rhodostoma CBS 690.94 TaxID=1392251 RepID=A0A9P4P5G9_9PLEO|nr:hypothetical protein P171DRAFT_492015 [Karstenula rhodostoma CBS 690.94]